MDSEVKLEFNTALEALEDSKVAFNNERYKNSIGRSYYAAFHGAKALLIKKRKFSKKHSGVLHLFGLEYIVNDDFDKKNRKNFI